VVPVSTSKARALAELGRHFRGRLREEPSDLAEVAGDFGGMVERRPLVALEPASEADVLLALRVAAEYSIPLTTRGAGHSQSGQGLGSGLVLNMTSLAGVLNLDSSSKSVEVLAGTSWQSVVDATSARGLLPVGLTHALDTSVAGTLSVAGVGAESFRVGAQVDNVDALDVALLSGKVVHCSRSDDPELFDAVRAGLGQCGIILRAHYPLRACSPKLRRRTFAYSTAERFLADAHALSDETAVGRWLSCTTKRGPSGGYVLLLSVGEEAGAPSAPVLAADFELRSLESDTWTPNGRPGHGFFRTFAEQRASAVARLNPWVEHLLDWQKASAGLAVLLQSTELLSRGDAGMIWVRRGASSAPLFSTPPGPMLAGLGVFPTFGSSERAQAERVLDSYAERMATLGGKRYLSGYFAEMPTSGWVAHYADAWDAFRVAKLRHDPALLLNPDFLRLGATGDHSSAAGDASAHASRASSVPD